MPPLLAEALATARRSGARFSITARQTATVTRAIAGIDEAAWTAIRYPNAMYDTDEQRWVSDAEVAEIAFTGRRRAEHVTALPIVRRVQRLNPKTVPAGQSEMFAVYRYHAVFTDNVEPMLVAEATHRDHAAVIEQLIAGTRPGRAVPPRPARSLGDRLLTTGPKAPTGKHEWKSRPDRQLAHA